MTQSLWFVMPAHGRTSLARVCMRQLARTIDEIRHAGIDAHAVVIACDENLDTARNLGFGTVERDNLQLGRRWNDGFQLAWRERVDYVVPIGSDDWLDHRWITEYELPGPETIRCMTRCAMVNETATTMRRMRVPYDGGVGIRIIPTRLLDRASGRPCVEDRQRAIDATTLRRLQQLNHHQIALSYRDLHPLQLVDWKTPGEQLNPFATCGRYAADEEDLDPFAELAGVFPTDALEEMHTVHAMEVPVRA